MDTLAPYFINSFPDRDSLPLLSVSLSFYTRSFSAAIKMEIFSALPCSQHLYSIVLFTKCQQEIWLQIRFLHEVEIIIILLPRTRGEKKANREERIMMLMMYILWPRLQHIAHPWRTKWHSTPNTQHSTLFAYSALHHSYSVSCSVKDFGWHRQNYVLWAVIICWCGLMCCCCKEGSSSHYASFGCRLLHQNGDTMAYRMCLEKIYIARQGQESCQQSPSNIVKPAF